MLIIVTSTFVLWLILHTPIFSIRTVEYEIEGDFVDERRVINIVENELSEFKYGIRVSTLAFFYKKIITEKVYEEISRAKEINIKRGFGKWNLEVIERNVFGTICREEKCFYIDDGGYVFDTTQLKLGHSILSEAEFEVSKYIYDKDDFKKIVQVSEFFGQNDIRIESITIGRDEEIKDILIRVEGGIDVWFSVENGIYRTTRAIYYTFFTVPESGHFSVSELKIVDVRDTDKIKFSRK